MFLVYKDENDKFQVCGLTNKGREIVFSDEFEEIPGMWGDWIEWDSIEEVAYELEHYFRVNR